MKAAIDRTGQTYGNLTVIERAADRTFPSGQRQRQWVARCTCGTVTTVLGSNLQTGHTQSCGCERTRTRTLEECLASRKPVVKYMAAHARVRRDKGDASGHPCVDCEERAAEWSYNHQDPDELVHESISTGGYRVRASYSLSPEFYEPRCRGCHRRFDRAQKRSAA